jgi:DNA repair exonuclease SbcCD ATPase subunit
MVAKISPYRQGAVRFGNRPHGIDTTVRTYQLTPEQLERLRAGEKLEDILREVKEMEQQKPKVIAYAKYEEVVAERDELKKQLEELKANANTTESSLEIERLKHEVIDAHQLVTEKEEEISHLQEMFNEAMTAKEQLQKENLLLENQVQRLKEVNAELTAQKERYFADLMRLEQEVKGLRLYALQKLHVDVYGA